MIITAHNIPSRQPRWAINNHRKDKPMYHISKKHRNRERGRWVLLEHIPTILSPRILLLVFLYSMAFTILLIGLKMFHLERRINNTTSQLASAAKTEKQIQSLLYQQQSNAAMQENIASQIIRLHVIANSDREEDQKLKLKVRDAITDELKDDLSASSTIEKARSTLLSRIPDIEARARQTIQQEGYSYPVRVTLGKRYFPVKIYGDLSFPAGNYEALCLEIGRGSGHNWWCVLFPSLCLLDETTAEVPEASKEKLRDSLSEEEYETLQTEPQEGKVEVHSAIYDWLSGK